jgi:hypothetical protein
LNGVLKSQYGFQWGFNRVSERTVRRLHVERAVQPAGLPLRRRAPRVVRRRHVVGVQRARRRVVACLHR